LDEIRLKADATGDSFIPPDTAGLKGRVKNRRSAALQGCPAALMQA